MHVLLCLINSNKSRLDVEFAVCEDGEGALGLIGALVHQIDLSNGSTRLNQTFTLTFYHFPVCTYPIVESICTPGPIPAVTLNYFAYDVPSYGLDLIHLCPRADVGMPSPSKFVDREAMQPRHN